MKKKATKKGKKMAMAKVTNTTDEAQQLGPHTIQPKGTTEVADHELDQHKKDAKTKQLFDSGKLKEETGSANATSQQQHGYGGSGSQSGQGR